MVQTIFPVTECSFDPTCIFGGRNRYLNQVPFQRNWYSFWWEENQQFWWKDSRWNGRRHFRPVRKFASIRDEIQVDIPSSITCSMCTGSFPQYSTPQNNQGEFTITIPVFISQIDWNVLLMLLVKHEEELTCGNNNILSLKLFARTTWTDELISVFHAIAGPINQRNGRKTQIALFALTISFWSKYHFEKLRRHENGPTASGIRSDFVPFPLHHVHIV